MVSRDHPSPSHTPRRHMGDAERTLAMGLNSFLPQERVEVISTREQPNGKVNRQVLEKLQMVTNMWENWYLGISSPHHPTSNPSPGPAYIKPEVSLQLVPFFNLLTISNATTLVHTTSSVGSPVCFRCPLWSHTCWLQVSSATNSLCTWRLKS